jgi:hypothetical protein
MNKRMATMLAGATGLVCLAVTGALAVEADFVEQASFTQTVAIAFDGVSVMVSNGAGAGVAYAQAGANLAVTSTVAGVEFILSGASAGGSFKLSNAYPAKVVLNGVNLASTNNPALQIRSTNRCYLVLARDTTNALADGSTYVDSVGGALYGAGPLIFSGTGRLTVAGKNTAKHGISSASYVRVRDGDIAVTSAAKDGLHSLSFRMDNGTVAVAATGDGIDGDAGTVEINGGAIHVLSVSNDLKGIKCDGAMTINGGALDLTVKGVQSKGLKCGSLVINGGALAFYLSGGPYLGTNTVVTTNGSVVTTNVYVDPSYCAAIKCDSNLTVNAGSITITHAGIAGKGISADGDIAIYGGTLDLYTSGGNSTLFTNDLKVLDTAAADCLKADGTLRILGGTIRATSTGNAGDAISAEGEAIIGVAGVTNTPTIIAATRGQKVLLYGSGNSAEYSNPKTFSAQGNVTVNGGTFRATTQNDGGEGMESKKVLTINGGNIEITAYDDCLNAASNVTINGGLIYCYSTGNDAIDSNGTLGINGGTIIASGTTAPEEGFDCDQNNFAIRGGTMVGTGGASSSPTAASCTQRSVLYKAAGSSGVVVQVKSATGNMLVYKVPRTYSGGGGGGGSASMTMLFSVPSLTNATYYIVTNATVTGGTEFHGLYTGATVTGGTTSKTFTASSMVTTVN